MQSPLVAFPPKIPNKELYLIGFRLDPAADRPQFYTLIGSEEDQESPITRQDRILFFRRPADALRALAASDNGFRDVRPIPTELELICEVGEALFVANQADADADGVLFELIAVFDDLLRAVKLNVPPEYSAVLSAAAASLGENQELAAFLNTGGVTREKLEDALLWCVGALTVKSSWVGEQLPDN
jgi:hypothetical protein